MDYSQPISKELQGKLERAYCLETRPYNQAGKWCKPNEEWLLRRFRGTSCLWISGAKALLKHFFVALLGLYAKYHSIAWMKIYVSTSFSVISGRNPTPEPNPSQGARLTAFELVEDGLPGTLLLGWNLYLLEASKAEVSVTCCSVWLGTPVVFCGDFDTPQFTIEGKTLGMEYQMLGYTLLPYCILGFPFLLMSFSPAPFQCFSCTFPMAAIPIPFPWHVLSLLLTFVVSCHDSRLLLPFPVMDPKNLSWFQRILSFSSKSYWRSVGIHYSPIIIIPCLSHWNNH